MLSLPNRTLLKIKISRFFRKCYAKIRSKLSGVSETTDPFGETITVEVDYDRANKLKSTAVVAVASVAIGINQLMNAANKTGKTVSRKGTLLFGLGTGAVSSYVWYNYMNAAANGVEEEDIMFMFDMVNNTGYGRLDEHEEGLKALDIMHTIITGAYEEPKNRDDEPMDFTDYSSKKVKELDEDHEDYVPKDESDSFTEDVDFESVEDDGMFHTGDDDFYEDDDHFEEDKRKKSMASFGKDKRPPIGLPSFIPKEEEENYPRDENGRRVGIGGSFGKRNKKDFGAIRESEDVPSFWEG